MYIISLVIICLSRLTSSTTNLYLNLTIMDRSEFYTVKLLNYFNHSLEYPTFEIDKERCQPKDITMRFNLTIQEERQNITQVTLQATNNGSVISLGNRTIIKTLTVPVQPIKLILADGGLIFLAMFDDKMSRGNQNRVSVVNMTTVLNSNRLMNCSDMAFDRKNYRIYVECGDGRGNFYNSALQLTRDKNNIVNAIRYVNNRVTSNYRNCRERKVLYIEDQVVDGFGFKRSIMVYCPYGKMDAGTVKAMVWSTNIMNMTVKVLNFTDCQRECCNHSQSIENYNDRLLFVTNSAVYSYALGFCQDKPLITFQEFRVLKIGAADYTQDLYLLTRDYLYIKFPSLTNTEIIDIKEQFMDPVGFSVTLDYIYIQMSNGTHSHLNIFKLTNTLPRLIYRSSLPPGSVIGDTGNYFSLADYFYLYDQLTNTLAIQSFIGTSLVIKYNFLAPLINNLANDMYIVCITNNNQSLFLNISVRNFRDKSLYIRSDFLYEQFTQRIVSIDLRQRVHGPLTQFHLADWNLQDGAYITGLQLINLNLNTYLLDKILAVRFTQNSNGSLVTVGYYINQTIYFHECNLIYNELISNFEVSNCDGFIDKHIEQNEIDLTKLKGIEAVVGYDKTVYILHDKQKILLCVESDGCYQKNYKGYGNNVTIEKLKVAYGGRSPEILLLLYNSADLSRTVYIYNLGEYNDNDMYLMLQINYTKISQLQNRNILDLQSDFIYTGSLALLTNTSHIYIIQRQRSDGQGDMPYLCHVTDVINGSQLFGCDRISHFFLMASQQHRRRLVIICQPLNKTDGFLQIVQFVVNNPFDVQVAREYPTYDYTVETDGHFSDNRYIYIKASNRNRLYYLVYDYLQSSPNVLLYKIPIEDKNYKYAVGTLNDNKQKQGLGYLDGKIYSVMQSLLVSQMDEMQERRVVLAVTNDDSQLVLFNFSITVDLNSSKLSYDSEIPVLKFSKEVKEHQLVIKLNKLRGPVQDINITTTNDESEQPTADNCDSFDIIRQDLIEPDRCLSYYGKPYGELYDFTSMTLQHGQQLVLTSTQLMCLHNKKLLTQKQWSETCEFRKFENSILTVDNQTIELALLLCHNENRNYMYLVKVNGQCQITTQLLGIECQATYFDVQASYPHIIMETPILLPQNRDYYICTLNDTILQNCMPLVRGLQDNFLSIDYDIGNGYGLILEKGLGVYEVKSYVGKDYKKWNATWWIDEKKFENDLEIVGPYTYIHFLNTGKDTLVFELGLSFESYEIQMTFHEDGSEPSLAILFHYKKYMDCKYTRDSNPQIFDKFIVKTCQTQPIKNYLLAGMAPILSKPARRFVQVYLREGDVNESWPVTMEELTVSQRFTVSGNFLVVNSKTNTICYYNLNNEIKWKIQVTLDERQNASSCNATITLENEYFSVDYTLELRFEGKQTPVETWLTDWWLHIVTGTIVLFSSVFYFMEMKPRRKTNKKIKSNFKQKKPGTQKNIFSNEFETQLRKIQSQRIL